MARVPRADRRAGPADTAVTGSVFAPRYRSMSVGVLMSVTIVAFQSLGVGTVMPAVARELHGLERYGWAFSAFMLASVVGSVAAGQDADRAGPVRPYLAAVAAFAAGSVLAAAAGSWTLLLAGRALEGLGAGALGVVTYASASRAYPAAMYGRMLALMSSAWVLPSLLGPAVAGLIADRATWRWVFVLLLPFLPIAVALTLPGLRALVRPERVRAPRRLPQHSRWPPAPGCSSARWGSSRRCCSPPRSPSGSGSRCPRSAPSCPPARCAPRVGCRRASSCAACSRSRSSAATRSCHSR